MLEYFGKQIQIKANFLFEYSETKMEFPHFTLEGSAQTNKQISK